jgi:hypothetical protein
MSLAPKKKIAVKKTHLLSASKIISILQEELSTTYDIEIKPDGWVLPNRVKFTSWLDKTFKYSKKTSKEIQKLVEKCDDGQACPKVNINGVSLFPHQHFIKDYMQFASPYRGILLFHGLGVGKSAASIATAEILLNHMDVVVMLPASLRNNYINEIKKYGKKFYRLKQHWIFVPLDNIKNELPQIAKILSIEQSYIQENNGLWIPNNSNGSPNFTSLTKEDQLNINKQIDHIIEKKFNFINYNGLKREHIKKMIANNQNPFDNKCIVIDEIHNLISRIVGGRLIGSAIYKLLMSAKNCKIILLSGTPIINYPYEIAYLINLITGPRKFFELTFKKDSDINDKNLTKIMEDNKNIDFFNFDRNTRKLTITMLPSGFAYSNRSTLAVERKTEEANESTSEEALLQNVIKSLTKNGFTVSKKYSVKESITLPEKEEDFNRYFINMDKGTVVNENLFMKRILGTVSFYSTYSQDLYPSVEIVDVPVPMNDFQFSIYEKSREEERKKEKGMKFKQGAKPDKNPNNPFASSGQVYRFYSRANCNFVFPEKIKRPFPSSIKAMKKLNEIDDFDDAASVISTDDDKVPDDYMSLLKEALTQISTGPYLEKKEIAQYSPKFKLILDKIGKAKGKCLVYSQFRTVEGLGLLGLSMQKMGYAEIKLKKVHGEYTFDIKEEDMKKPKYMMFTGSNEETQILLNIFNSNFENIPESLKLKLKDISDYDGNVYGEMIKVIMITQSGAEGISLKHVRQVHVLEPYWNHIRIDQVVGRAVRTGSHVDLPPSERNVLVYIYYCTFTEKQLANSFTIKTLDKGKTSDEHIFDIAKRKKSIIDNILELLKRASVDCALNGHTHPGLKCYSFPVNIDENQVTFTYDISHELEDYQYANIVDKQEFEGEVYITKKGNFLINKITNEVYDYDIYINSKKLVKIGTLKIVGKEKQIIKN